VAGRAAIGAAEAFWLALIAALVAWVVSPSANPSGDPTPGCAFVGRGGVICDGSATAVRKATTEIADSCFSLGRGGRYCPPVK
jgi:tRNA A37 threonylcarbamoyladenosine synthetase subunit TsaC/SUA5/YrdC